jgi:DNA-binding MarR family transcriptional regulator
MSISRHLSVLNSLSSCECKIIEHLTHLNFLCTRDISAITKTSQRHTNKIILKLSKMGLIKKDVINLNTIALSLTPKGSKLVGQSDEYKESSDYLNHSVMCSRIAIQLKEKGSPN